MNEDPKGRRAYGRGPADDAVLGERNSTTSAPIKVLCVMILLFTPFSTSKASGVDLTTLYRTLRFGNEAFVTWYDKMVADLPSVMQRVLLPLSDAADENERQKHHEMIGTTNRSPSVWCSCMLPL